MNRHGARRVAFAQPARTLSPSGCEANPRCLRPLAHTLPESPQDRMLHRTSRRARTGKPRAGARSRSALGAARPQPIRASRRPPGELPNRRLSRDRPLTQRRGSLAPAVGWICLAGTASPCRCLRMGVVIVPSLGCRSSALPPRRWWLQSETPASTPWITGTQRARVLHRPLRDHDGLGLPGGGDVLEQMNFRPIGHAVRDTVVHPCVASPTRTQGTARTRSLRPGTLV